MQSRPYHILRIVVFAFAGFLLLFQVVAITLALPPVQTKAIIWVKNYFANEFGVRAELEGVQMALPAKAVLSGLDVYAESDELICRLGELRMNVLDFDFWEYVFDRENGQALSLGALDLIAPEFHLYRRPDSTMNVDFLKSDTPADESEQADSGRQLAINIPGVHIEGGVFTYIDSAAPEVDSIFTNRINFARIALADITGDFAFYSQPSGSIEASTSNLGFSETNSGFEVSRLSAELFKQTIRTTDPNALSPTVSILEFRDMFLEVFETRIAADLRIASHDLSTLLDKVPDEQFDLLLKPSRIGFQALSYFFRKPLPLAGSFRAKGVFSGTLQSMRSNTLELTYLKDTRLAGQVALLDYTEPDSMFLNINLNSSSSFSFAELQALLPEVAFPPSLISMKPLELEGSYLGRYYDFKTDAAVRSEGGILSWNLHLMLPSHYARLAYEGSFETANFNIDQLGLTESPVSDDATLSGRIKGSGVGTDQMVADISGAAIQTRLRGVLLDSVHVTAAVDKGIVSGDFQLIDAQGNADMKIKANFAATDPIYSLDGYVSSLSLAAYGLRFKTR